MQAPYNLCAIYTDFTQIWFRTALERVRDLLDTARVGECDLREVTGGRGNVRATPRTNRLIQWEVVNSRDHPSHNRQYERLVLMNSLSDTWDLEGAVLPIYIRIRSALHKFNVAVKRPCCCQVASDRSEKPNPAEFRILICPRADCPPSPG